ncbi:MAG TPA: bifunctional oligoribonuclease/PAP phosphatase NrnA [Anaerolineales bacterium]|nr:bifunctional oligoribonuclease/PAP phosphatase NrnA [Anaerolineales bacterium]
MEPDLDRARALLERASRIAVVSHERPDGDAVGSLLGLTLALQRRGQTAVAVLGGGLPARYRFLPGADGVVSSLPSDAELIVAVDCAEWRRSGLTADDLRRPVGLNVDHHPTNTNFAQVNLVDPQAASTTQILFTASAALGLPVDQTIATNYLAGLVTDTIGFRTPNVTPEVLRVAASLEAQASALAVVYERLLNQRSYAAARYWGAGLSRLERHGNLIWTRLTLEDRVGSGYNGSDDADLVNLLGTIEGAEVCLVFIEQSRSEVKVSWRSSNGLDVARLAQGFGGGGHEPAAGATVSGPLEEVVARVVEATRAAMESMGSSRR